ARVHLRRASGSPPCPWLPRLGPRAQCATPGLVYPCAASQAVYHCAVFGSCVSLRCRFGLLVPSPCLAVSCASAPRLGSRVPAPRLSDSVYLCAAPQASCTPVPRLPGWPRVPLRTPRASCVPLCHASGLVCPAPRLGPRVPLRRASGLRVPMCQASAGFLYPIRSQPACALCRASGLLVYPAPRLGPRVSLCTAPGLVYLSTRPRVSPRHGSGLAYPCAAPRISDPCAAPRASCTPVPCLGPWIPAPRLGLVYPCAAPRASCTPAPRLGPRVSLCRALGLVYPRAAPRASCIPAPRLGPEGTCPVPAFDLDGENIVFGRVLEGLEVMDAVARVPTFMPPERVRIMNNLAGAVGDDRAAKARTAWSRPRRQVVITDCGIMP
ncbi:hypothetical protein CYMTET_17603, partial [Cymbomonas tetramitiformis]